MSKYQQMTKAQLIDELKAHKAGLGVDLDGIEQGLAALDRVVTEVVGTNVVNYGLKPQVHDRWKRDLSDALRMLREAAALRPTTG